MPLLTIEDRYELLALHRALLEAKLHPSPEDIDVPGSPILARLAERIIEALISAELAEGKEDARDRWTEWRRAEAHPARVEAARKAVEQCSDWARLAPDEKRSLVVDTLSPLLAQPDLISELVRNADAHHDG